MQARKKLFSEPNDTSITENIRQPNHYFGEAESKISAEESAVTGRFQLMALDELSEVQHIPECLRLVCLTDSGGKLAIWGSDEDRRNIDWVLKKGMPCTVECEYIEPLELGLVWGHSYWVPENSSLRIIELDPGKIPR